MPERIKAGDGYIEIDADGTVTAFRVDFAVLIDCVIDYGNRVHFRTLSESTITRANMVDAYPAEGSYNQFHDRPIQPLRDVG